MKRICSSLLALLIASSAVLATAPASTADASLPVTVHLQGRTPVGLVGTQGFSSELKAWMCKTFGSMCG